MLKPWVVLKFGGTSVAGAPQWTAIRELVGARREAGHRVLVVCSALAGVTDHLQELAARDDHDGIDTLLERHRRIAAELGFDADDVLEEGERRLRGALKGLSSGGSPALAEWLSQGEWLSSRLGARFLYAHLDAGWVDAREALLVEPEPDPDGRRAWLGARCESHVDAALTRRWGERPEVLVTQGFVAASPDGRTALLGRGGSDTSAALLGSRLNADRVEIWTDVNGLYSADPKRLETARLIERVAYDEALEMAAGGARVVHGRAIRAAAAVNLPLWVRNLSRPAAAGTTIDGRGDPEDGGIRAVIEQTGMLVLLLENLDTRQQVGFLAGVFGVVSGQGVSVDLVATSETTTTLAIDRVANHLEPPDVDRLVDGLAGLCRVEVFPACSCVNLVGRAARRAFGRTGVMRDFLETNRLLMVSYSANDLCVSLLLDASAAPALVRLLHRELVEAA